MFWFSVLNREDPDWYWIVRSDGQEGFIPSGFVYPAVVQRKNNISLMHHRCIKAADRLPILHFTAAQQESTQPALSPQPPAILNNTLNTSQDSDGRYHGTELVMLYDYKVPLPQTNFINIATYHSLHIIGFSASHSLSISLDDLSIDRTSGRFYRSLMNYSWDV